MIHRFTHPLISLLPDLSHTPVRRQVVGAMIASVMLHFLILFAIVIASGLLPTPRLDFARAKPNVQELELVLPELEPLEMEIVRPEELLNSRPQRETIDSTGLAQSVEQPKEAVFESDQDMKAASEQPGTGNVPLPTLAGKDLPFTNFTTQDVSLGSPKIDPAPAPSDAKPALPAPIFKPQPIPRDQVNAPPRRRTTHCRNRGHAGRSGQGNARRHYRKSKRRRKIKLRWRKRRNRCLASLPPPMRPHPVPVPAAGDGEAGDADGCARARDAAGVSGGTRAKPDRREHYEPREERRWMRSKRRSGVYKRQVNAAIGSRWYYYVTQQRDLIAFGSVKVSYAITAGGQDRGRENRVEHFQRCTREHLSAIDPRGGNWAAAGGGASDDECRAP